MVCLLYFLCLCSLLFYRTMIRMKDQVVSPRSLSVNSNCDSQQIVQLPLENSCSFYSYSSHNNAQQIIDEIHCNLISILLIFLFISVALFTITFSLKYIIIATATYGNPHNCLQSGISFDGWNFQLHCLQCQLGHELDHLLHCQPF